MAACNQLPHELSITFHNSYGRAQKKFQIIDADPNIIWYAVSATV